ncbi:hypothetical protein [Actinoplanes solisilvae]|uniref:hypothetical protein n=1 Tax=Actinoplanes solisilvae TaxID=2486853 RepID=UPI000FDAE808|nr:hypothetical protein [Actinoplanes solisilvae]
MEPVPVTLKVRRTVRLAVALVVGQALLCALIGWLTLGQSRPEPARPPGSSVVDAMGAPPSPPAIRPTSRAVPAPATRARKATSTPAPRRSTNTPAPRTAATTPTPVPIEGPPEDPAVVPPVPPPAASPPATSPPPADVVQQPVREGDECRPLGARGRTAKGEDVRCVREWPRQLRWRIV